MPPVKKVYSLAEAEAAVNNSNGQTLASGVGIPANRMFNNKGNGRGHEYMHRGFIPKHEFRGDHPTGENLLLSQREKNILAKSRTEDRRASYKLTMALLNSPQGQEALGELDALGENPGIQKWPDSIDIVGEDLYGYEPNGTVVRKISKGRINFRKIHGCLFVSSVYPTEFQGERDFGLGDFFENVMNAWIMRYGVSVLNWCADASWGAIKNKATHIAGLVTSPAPVSELFEVHNMAVSSFLKQLGQI